MENGPASTNADAGNDDDDDVNDSAANDANAGNDSDSGTTYANAGKDDAET